MNGHKDGTTKTIETFLKTIHFGRSSRIPIRVSKYLSHDILPGWYKRSIIYDVLLWEKNYKQWFAIIYYN